MSVNGPGSSSLPCPRRRSRNAWCCSDHGGLKFGFACRSNQIAVHLFFLQIVADSLGLKRQTENRTGQLCARTPDRCRIHDRRARWPPYCRNRARDGSCHTADREGKADDDPSEAEFHKKLFHGMCRKLRHQVGAGRARLSVDLGGVVTATAAFLQGDRGFSASSGEYNDSARVVAFASTEIDSAFIRNP